MAESSWRRRWRWLTVPAALLALAWAAWLLRGALPALRDSLPRLDSGWLWWTLGGSLVSGYLSFEAFRALFERLQPGAYRRFALAHLYFTGQLMKHLPGRIWGVAYQSAVGARATLMQWVGVSTAYMVLVTAFALWVALCALGFSRGWLLGGLALIAGAVLYDMLWRAGPLLRLLGLLRKLRVPVLGRFCDAIQPFACVDAGFKFRVWSWFSASWLVYLLAWAGFGLAWPGLTAGDGVWLCALYTAAWFVGYISLVSPSGIGVRELVFVALAHDFPTDAVAGMAVMGRVILLLVDMLLGLVFMPCRGVER